MGERLPMGNSDFEKNIKVLKERGLLIRHGAARGGYWEIRE